MPFPLDSVLRTTFWSLIGRMWSEQAPTQPHVHQVLEILHSNLGQRGARVVDVGCGAGVYSIALAEAGFDVIGIDAAKGMLAQARKNMPSGIEARLRFEEGDLDGRLPYQDSQFDAAIAISVLQATGSPEHASKEVIRILRPGGILVVLHFGRQDYHAHPLWQQIKHRITTLRRKTGWNMILAAVKVIAEQSGGSRYWSIEELHDLLRAQGFQVESTPATNPIIVVARQPSAPKSNRETI